MKEREAELVKWTGGALERGGEKWFEHKTRDGERKRWREEEQSLNVYLGLNQIVIKIRFKNTKETVKTTNTKYEKNKIKVNIRSTKTK